MRGTISCQFVPHHLATGRVIASSIVALNGIEEFLYSLFNVFGRDQRSISPLPSQEVVFFLQSHVITHNKSSGCDQFLKKTTKNYEQKEVRSSIPSSTPRRRH